MSAVALVLSFAGCYAVHQTGGPGPVLDAAPFASDGRVVGDGAPSSACLDGLGGVAGPLPALRYSFEHDLRNRGSWPGGDGSASGQVVYVAGPDRTAAQLPIGTAVTYVGTARFLASAPALTFSIWIHSTATCSGGGPTAGRQYLGCRTWNRGFDSYGCPTAVTSCAGDGFGAPRGWGGCATVGGPTCSDGWTQWVFRWRGVGTAPDVGASGASLTRMGDDADPLLSGVALFDQATDLVSGNGVGDGSGAANGVITIDEIRVYDVALADDVIWTVTRAPLP